MPASLLQIVRSDLQDLLFFHSISSHTQISPTPGTPKGLICACLHALKGPESQQSRNSLEAEVPVGKLSDPSVLEFLHL